MANVERETLQCRDLRRTIPKMLESMTVKQTSRMNAHVLPPSVPVLTKLAAEETYQHFIKSVNAAHQEIKDFGDLYHNKESQKALTHAKKSREANPMGIAPWRAKDDPHWYDLDA